MRISREHFELMKLQINLDCNVKEAHKIKDDIYIAPSRVLNGSRIIDKLSPFFRVVVFMGTAYVMADEDTIPGWEEILKDYPAEWFFNYGRLRKIDRILNEFDMEIIDTHLYFLPDADAPVIDIPSDWKWFTKKDIEDFRENNPFHSALCYSPTQPDVYGLAAPVNREATSLSEKSAPVSGKSASVFNREYSSELPLLSEDNYMAMAGASEDGKYTRQIGIDVKDIYRGMGLATNLVTGLKQEILKDGYLPFYGTSESHAISRSVGVKSGFLPAFSELFVGRIDKKLDGIYS